MGKPILYKVRNRVHEVLGLFAEEDLLHRIAQGQYEGEEEVSAPPYEHWQKISAHPVFYDAFLRRLFSSEYLPPEEEGTEREPASIPPEKKTGIEKATRQVSDGGESQDPAPLSEHEKDRSPRTSQVEEDRERQRGETIHQSLIDELFTKSQPQPSPPEPQGEVSAEELAKIGTDLIPVEKAPAQASQMFRPLDLGEVNEAENPEVAARQRARSRRRRIFAVCSSLLLLVLLFQWGISEKKTKSLSNNIDSLMVRPDPQILNDPSSKDEKIKTLVEEADRLYENDESLFYRGSMHLYEQALSYDSSNTLLIGRYSLAAARSLAGAVDSQGLVSKIQAYLKKGRTLDPQFSQFYRTEALVALYEKNFEQARRFISAAIDTDPSSIENSLVAGEVYLGLKDKVTSRNALNEVTKADPLSVRAHFLLGKLALLDKDFKRAKLETLASLKINPLHAQSYYQLGQISEDQKELRNAKDLFETSLKLARLTDPSFSRTVALKLASFAGYARQPSYEQKYKELAAFLGAGREGSDATKAFAEKMEYPANYYDEEAANLIQRQKYREAIIFLEASYLVKQRDARPLVKLGELYEKLAASYDDFRTVVGFYQRAIERDPSLTEAYIRLGLLETDQYNLDRGYKLLAQAVALAPDQAEPYVALGKHFYKRQDYNEALNQFIKASKINPEDSEIIYYAGLLRLMFKKDGAKDSISYFYRAYLLNPQNYDALVEWLKLKVLTYEKNFAIKFVRHLIEQEPNNANLYWVLGEVYAANKEFRRAIEYYHRSLDFDNRSSRTRMSLAKGLEAIGDLKKAVAEFRLSSFLDRKNSEGFYRAADLLFQLKAYDQAEEVLKFLVEGCPNYPGAQRYLSKIYQLRGQKDLAIAAMQKEVTHNPQNAKFRLELAEVFMSYEKWNEAVTELTELTNLPSLTQAPEFLYDKIRAYLLLSRCYRALNRYESAEGAIKLAMEIDFNDPELHRELGYVYHAMQREKEAVDAFEFYLSREPAAKDADKIKAMIQQMIIEE